MRLPLFLLLVMAGAVHAQSPQEAYAARKLSAAVPAGYSTRLVIRPDGLGPEAFSVTLEGKTITVTGGDARGLIYGALALAEKLRSGTRSEDIKPFTERPALAFRGIKFNLPWDTYRPSSALDQHRDTARDLKFWEAFLDMMVENRFNAVSLWNLHPFTYMVQPKNFPKASPWSEREFRQWQHLYREIFRMAKERGLDTYIVFWSIFVSREFAQHYGAAKENFYPHYYVPGDTSDVVRRYLRESVTQVLQEYPDLDGIGVSHGEGMADMTPLQRQQWVDEVGSETYIPALDYFTATKEAVDWKWAFQRQWLFYKLWGRLLYDPKTPDAVFQAEFDRRYGEKGANLLNAYSLASATQLRLASLYDSRWDFTLYSEGFLALQGDYTRYISVDHLIRQPTMDPAYVSVAEYVETLAKGGSFGAGRITPPVLIGMLERDNREALRLVGGIDTSGNAPLRQEAADVQIWANLGLHLAEKLRGAVALQTFRVSGTEHNKDAAVEHLRRALGYWDEVVRIARPLYRDMKLTHYNHNFFHANGDNLFHWALIRDEVAKDVAIAETG